MNHVVKKDAVKCGLYMLRPNCVTPVQETAIRITIMIPEMIRYVESLQPQILPSSSKNAETIVMIFLG